ncbi:hypothetical protein PQR46_20390 [Paraburkholderia sediminicola]|uniref:hypothetical protein n=1 Tax=Paraburkholderia sediminicola TaxID=458836 RepID=UPI0038BB615C
MNQQQREAYIRTREDEVFGREPTMGASAPQVMTTEQRAQEAMQRLHTRQRHETLARSIKLALWLAAWFGMACLCQKAAEAMQVRDAVLVTAILEVIGTALMLAVTFWRYVLSLAWLVIVLVIIAAVIKWAFLFVF